MYEYFTLCVYILENNIILIIIVLTYQFTKYFKIKFLIFLAANKNLIVTRILNEKRLYALFPLNQRNM